LLRICFVELGLRRVYAQCFADNAPSWRIMEKLGMRREAHNLRESLHRSGQWLDGMAYAILAEEWREGRVRTRGSAGRVAS
jgi:RimJ/RimL family protein N-acetyltransferase